ncbi:polyketide cyclase [Heliobacterium chlorum]|uniref:Polyketide cyclase n=1 Tax=Heliobacterium chlorum TaxID=2698 RepID=A0ABR7T5M4_HELCL|nr:polyketide cyclase [Heliobacterium chlorum]MBC9785532.1 polyketide cyclase [Heliobacterium chlorum]
MTEFSFQTEVNASPEEIWAMYANPENRFKWESDLEHIKLNGEFISGVTGCMKLKGMPAMEFTLTYVKNCEEFWDKTEVPEKGMALCFGHTLTRLNNKTLIKHTVKLEKSKGDITEDDINFLFQVFKDTPDAILAIKKEVEQ